MTEVSIVIPTYNRATSLGAAIQSILDQTYQDFEIIVVDDFSSDDTEKVVKGFQDKRISYIRHAENRGASCARNTGIKRAKGRFVAFQDSDDIWLPSKLMKQIEVMSRASNEVGVVYTGYIRTESGVERYNPPSYIDEKQGNIYRQLLKGNFVGTAMVLARKDCLEEVGLFDEEIYNYGEDWELWLRVAKRYLFILIDEPLVLAPVGDDSNVKNLTRKTAAIERILALHEEEFNRDPKSYARHLYLTGINYCRIGRMKDGRRLFVRSAFKRPLSILPWMLVLTSFLGRSRFISIMDYSRNVLGISSRV
ncbi:MAG: glycosyltransferase family 2 protein [Methanomassiliicoccales archaeon]|nr:glycosyltransferase family 2 protein [Methanomassiliicoccales archaeon]